MSLEPNAPARTRLTFDERRRIATGLGMGLSFAEIGRRLGRPKSTIIREVARNGGAHGYRADRAQQATAWRAQRRRPVAAPEPPAARGGDPREFEEHFAAMMVQTGVRPMMAKVLVGLFTSDTGSLTAAELVAGLRVSPASVSTAVRWLEERGLARRERDGRRQRYVIDEHVWYQAWLVSVRSMTLWADCARRGAQVFGDSPAGARLRNTSRFFEHLRRDMAQAAEHWRNLPYDR
ncbi:MarR family transcriptional regulator [Amycolatopsis deserti]|uniref:MarR family transcriptional regulator n=1 Tax=Amycolatopsis deserti TaxID=185696 RepID=A0ABQ3ISY7_9PSEU|nr:helix-turn-helix domain-containing protein [Amycolatopsis deserti]GHE90352.1 MarR family transcriptional regulator [Amycolatopsis deserti]